MIRGSVRALDFLSRLTKYFAVSSLKTSRMDEATKNRYLAQHVHEESAKLIKSLGFELKVFGYTEEMKSKNFLTVGNHMSYMDVFLLAAVHPTLFVTSVDMGETPGLGHVTRQAGCIFVERRNRSSIEKDVRQMTDALSHGINVTIYPEGTSSDGLRVLPFKKALLTAAIEAGVDVLPVVLKYTEIDGEAFSEKNNDKIAWYGDMGFGPHFLKLMNTKSLKAELHFLEPVRVTKESTRHELAAKAESAIRSVYMEGKPEPKTPPPPPPVVTAP
jgi:lyso-ornithine lipid O-acyltransferase